MRTQIQRLMAKGVGGLFIAHCGPVALTAAEEAVDLGFEGHIMLYNCFASTRAAQSVKGFANGKVVTFAPDYILGTSEPGDPQHEAIEEYYEHGGEPDNIVATGWDGMQVIAQAIEEAGSTDAAAIVRTLEAGLSYVGAWSMNTFSAEDHRGAAVEGALNLAVFTKDGELVPAPTDG